MTVTKVCNSPVLSDTNLTINNIKMAMYFQSPLSTVILKSPFNRITDLLYKETNIKLNRQVRRSIYRTEIYWSKSIRRLLGRFCGRPISLLMVERAVLLNTSTWVLTNTASSS